MLREQQWCTFHTLRSPPDLVEAVAAVDRLANQHASRVMWVGGGRTGVR
jgi:hypothetical protein